jgi:DNA-directed RNA polymerase beta subunit
MYINLNVEKNSSGNLSEDSSEKTSEILDAYFGRLPVMVFSSLCHNKESTDRVLNNECEHDPGGYFIIKGGEKVLVSQKVSWENRITVYKKSNSCTAAIKSEREHRQFVTTMKFVPNSGVTILFPRIETEVPFMTLMVALGCQSKNFNFTDEEQILLMETFKFTPSSMEEAQSLIRTRSVYDVNKTSVERLETTFDLMLLPHITTDYNEDGSIDYRRKYCFLVHMLKELMLVQLGKRPPTNRDNLINQRVQMSSSLLSKLFYQLLIKWTKNMNQTFNIFLSKLKNPITDEKIKKTIGTYTGITDGLNYAFSTGIWSTLFVNNTRLVGVSQVLQRASYKATLSYLMKVVNSNFDKEMKNPQPRYLNSSQYGRLCPSETSEGATVGLDCTLAISAYVSMYSDPTPVVSTLLQYLLPISIENMSQGDPVFVNGAYLGNTVRTERLVQTIRFARRTGQFKKDISVSGMDGKVEISTTSGRICRPLLIAQNGVMMRAEKGMTWAEMLSNGKVEYLDAEEENECFISSDWGVVFKDHTHVEISNTLMNGANAASIPFSNCNPSPRNLFQCAMGKQAQGVPALNYQFRMDTTMNVLNYTQRALVTTDLAKMSYHVDMSAGINVVIATMCYKGLGQEDSIIMNQRAVDLGLFRADRFTTVQDTLTNNSKEASVYMRPTTRKRQGCFSKIDSDGLLSRGVKIQKRDCVIGKQTTVKTIVEGEVDMVEDSSRMSSVIGSVQETILYEKGGGGRGVKTKIRSTRVPKMGDKFCSRHGQKGIVSMIIPPEDMPFTRDGITPDVIINPHALPSRMTVGHIMEAVAGKLTSLTNEQIDASPFAGTKIEDIVERLHKAGFQRHADEMLINGMTGEQMKCKISMGVVYYQRLKHMVDDKAHARGRGPKNALTKQPNSGRANGGALRLGEMEVFSCGTWGVPNVLQDRLLHCSNAYDIHVCPDCGVDVPKGCDTCQRCDTVPKKVTIPYAFQLLRRELDSMGIKTKLKV